MATKAYRYLAAPLGVLCWSSATFAQPASTGAAGPAATTPGAAVAPSAPAPTPIATTPAAAAAPSPAPTPPVAATPGAATDPAPADAAAPAVLPAPTPDAPRDTMSPTDPLAGWSGETAFLRSSDNQFVLLPSGRLQVDGYFFKRDTDKMPTPGILLRRARLELAGWIGPWVFFGLAGDFAAGAPAGADPVSQSWLATTDDFVGIAPWGNLAMLQVGQFDAPFTMENRTSDKYFDFMERSMTVRAFGVPSNKETGAMVNGHLPDGVAHYSLGVFDGDGQNFRNTDSAFDVIGRAFVAPFALAGVKDLAGVTVGGSIWLGKRGDRGLRLAPQTTQGGFSFFDPTWKLSAPAGSAAGTAGPGVEVHQHGDLKAFALELNAPLTPRFGVRAEYVNKAQQLAITDAASAAAGSYQSLAGAKLEGWAAYGEVYAWVVGDDKIVPPPGLELPSRLKGFETKAPRDGVMLAARVDHVDENITTNTTLVPDKASGSRRVTAFELGVNYWHSKRFRASFNYVLNLLGGDSPGIKDAIAKVGGHDDEHEFLFRLGIAL